MNVVTQTASSVHFRMPLSMSRSIPETLQKPAAKTDGRRHVRARRADQTRHDHRLEGVVALADGSLSRA